MASTIPISCPKCEKQINAPAELAGKKIRCKECLHVFVVPKVKAAKAGNKGAKAAKEDKEDKEDKSAGGPIEEADANPYDVTDHSFLPRCPFCAKELDSEDQVICLNCGYNRRTRERVHSKKTYETTGGEIFVWLLPGILCALGVLLLIGNIVVFWLLFPRLEKENESVFFGLWARLWGSVIDIFIAFFLGRFAVRRLILHPTPPEKEKHK